MNFKQAKLILLLIPTLFASSAFSKKLPIQDQDALSEFAFCYQNLQKNFLSYGKNWTLYETRTNFKFCLDDVSTSSKNSSLLDQYEKYMMNQSLFELSIENKTNNNSSENLGRLANSLLSPIQDELNWFKRSTVAEYSNGQRAKFDFFLAGGKLGAYWKLSNVLDKKSNGLSEFQISLRSSGETKIEFGVKFD